MYSYEIQEFYGIQQQKDGNLLPAGSAYDARNIETKDGNLSVASGFSKKYPTAIPGVDRLIKIIPVRGYQDKLYVVGQSSIYAYTDDAWASIYSFPTALTTKDVDFLQTKIGTDECILVATGEQQIVKISLADDSASLFGSGEYVYTGTVVSYDEITKAITVSPAMDEQAQRRAYVDGIYYGKYWAAVDIVESSTKIILLEEPETTPAADDVVKIRGGGSDAHVKYLDSYYSRLFSAGDPDAKSRLYWSAIPGDGRTVEDWLSVDASEDASGGYVEIGEADSDEIIGISALSNQIIIFKRYSVWRLYGDRPSTFTVERIDKNGEQMSNSSVVVLYDQPFYLTKNGLTYYNGSALTAIDGGAQSLMRFLQTISSVTNSRGAIAQNRMYFSCNVGGGLYDDAIVQYDVHRQSYMIRDGFLISDITSYDGDVFLLSDARYVYQFETGDTYDGDPINAYWISQPTDLGMKTYKKQITQISFRATGYSVVFHVIAGKVKMVVHRLLNDDEDGYVMMPISIDQARRFSFRIENEAGKYFSIVGGLEASFIREMK